MKLLQTLKHVIMLLCISTTMFAQPYIKFGGGYGFDFGGIATAYQLSSSQIYNGTETQYANSYDIKYHSLGKGFFVVGSAGMPLNSNIDVEAEFRYVFSPKYESKSTSEYTTTVFPFTKSTYQTISNWQSSLFSFTPTLSISANIMNYKPYVKFGAIIAIPKFTSESNWTSSSGSSDKEKNEYSGGLGWGGAAALGSKLELNEKIILFGELYFNHISWSPAKLSETDNNDITKTYDLSSKFSESYKYVNGEKVPEVTKKYSQAIPFNSMGFNLGVQIKLGE